MWRCALVDCFNPQKEAYCLELWNARHGLAFTDVAGSGPRLPRLSIPGWSSTARQIQAKIRPWCCIRAFGQNTGESSSKDIGITLPELLFKFDSAQSREESEWPEAEALFRSSLSEEECSCLNG